MVEFAVEDPRLHILMVLKELVLVRKYDESSYRSKQALANELVSLGLMARPMT